MSLRVPKQDGSYHTLHAKRLITRGKIISKKIKTSSIVLNGTELSNSGTSSRILNYDDPSLQEGGLVFLPSDLTHITLTVDTTENQQDVVVVLPRLSPGQTQTVTILKSDVELGEDFDVLLFAYQIQDKWFGQIDYSGITVGGINGLAFYLDAGKSGCVNLIGMGQENGEVHWTILNSIGEWNIDL